MNAHGKYTISVSANIIRADAYQDFNLEGTHVMLAEIRNKIDANGTAPFGLMLVIHDMDVAARECYDASEDFSIWLRLKKNCYGYAVVAKSQLFFDAVHAFDRFVDDLHFLREFTDLEAAEQWIEQRQQESPNEGKKK